MFILARVFAFPGSVIMFVQLLDMLIYTGPVDLVANFSCDRHQSTYFFYIILE